MLKDTPKRPHDKEKNIKNNKLTKSSFSQSGETETSSSAHHSSSEEAETGLVIAHYGSKAKVETITYASSTTANTATSKREIFICHQRPNLGEVITGDRVLFQRTEDGQEGKNSKGVIVKIEPRLNVLSRPKEKKKDQLIAANITQMVVVVAPTPFLPETLISRYLVLATSLGFKMSVLINKCDLEGQALEDLRSFLAIYQNLNIPVLEVSTRAGLNEEKLDLLLKDNVSIFVGQSGVGKSSLVNQLIPGSDIKVSELSNKSKKGCHTTTGTALYHLENGGDLIDSPGIRQLHLWDFSTEEIEHGFKEFEPYLGKCRFRNCAHGEEPGCALNQAIKEGHIQARRFEHYRILVNSGKLLK